VPLTRSFRATVTRLAGEASFIFDGVVERHAASSLSVLAATPGTAIVRVGRVYDAAGDLRDQEGQVVTVVFPSRSLGVEPGAQRLFFADPFIYGETVGVRAIEILDAEEDVGALSALVQEVTARMEEERLREHLAEADAVFQGVVTDRHEVEDPSPLSEHRPDWWVAVISIIAVLKGNLTGELLARYPSSTDVRWYTTPKPAVGQEALFVLHRDGLHYGGTGLAILHPGDVTVVDRSELERHRRLIRPE
jgi:hypothetical protein